MQQNSCRGFHGNSFEAQQRLLALQPTGIAREAAIAPQHAVAGHDHAQWVAPHRRTHSAHGLRFADEFAKHKLLDAIGDLYIVGRPLLAAFSAHKSGHALNNQLLRALLADETAWEIVTFERADQAPSAVARLYPQAA